MPAASPDPPVSVHATRKSTRPAAPATRSLRLAGASPPCRRPSRGRTAPACAPTSPRGRHQKRRSARCAPPRGPMRAMRPLSRTVRGRERRALPGPGRAGRPRARSSCHNRSGRRAPRAETGDPAGYANPAQACRRYAGISRCGCDESSVPARVASRAKLYHGAPGSPRARTRARTRRPSLQR